MNDSKMKFQTALLSLTQIYSFKEITITQLAQEAGLSRKSFYRLFQTKENLLEESLAMLSNELIKQLRTILKDSDTKKFERSIKAYLAYWEANHHYLRFIVDNLFDAELNETLLCATSDLFQRESNLFPTLEMQEDYIYTLVYIQGGVNAILFRWYEEGMVKSVDELTNNIVSLYKNAMEYVYPNV